MTNPEFLGDSLLVGADVQFRMARTFLNLACGDFYLTSPDWTNLDFYPHSKYVTKANLLQSLPFPSENFDVVYTSHFIEHIPKSRVFDFLTECHRVLKPNGVIRIIVPDFENIAREYIQNINANNLEYAEFNIIEMIDQCVRTRSGGELSSWRARAGITEITKQYISSRTGYQYKDLADQPRTRRGKATVDVPKLLLRKIMKIYSTSILKLLPKWFVENHVNLTNTGELHRWVYDSHLLKKLLLQVGFGETFQLTAESSTILDFPLYPLDIDESARSRKGKESMYLEARK